jgi:hypothetical protein
MKRNFKHYHWFILLFIISFVVIAGSSCHFYRFKDIGTIPDSVKTVRVNFIENRAPYVNPQLSASLTDRLKQKIVNQTRLTSTTSDAAHYDIHGYVSDYSVSTTGITSTGGRSQTSINRLTVTVHITLNKQLTNEPPLDFDVSRNFDFSASQSLEQVQATLIDEIVRNLSDEIFNRIFSNW